MNTKMEKSTSGIGGKFQKGDRVFINSITPHIFAIVLDKHENQYKYAVICENENFPRIIDEEFLNIVAT